MNTHTDKAQLYTIREVARLSGLSESTLRYYETIGLIHPITRDARVPPFGYAQLRSEGIVDGLPQPTAPPRMIVVRNRCTGYLRHPFRK